MTLPGIGALRHRVTIEAPVRTATEGGAAVESWSQFATVFASLTPAAGRERVVGDGIDADVSHVIRCRYRAGVTAAMRVNFGGRLFDIRAVIDEGERRRWLRLHCEERRA
ncbi:MAG: phage head closure protein [Pseudomonadota bacterium]